MKSTHTKFIRSTWHWTKFAPTSFMPTSTSTTCKFFSEITIHRRNSAERWKWHQQAVSIHLLFAALLRNQWKHVDETKLNILIHCCFLVTTHQITNRLKYLLSPLFSRSDAVAEDKNTFTPFFGRRINNNKWRACAINLMESNGPAKTRLGG